MLSLTSKYLCFGPEHNAKGDDPMKLKFEDLEIQKWNIATSKVQRVDKKWVNLSSYHVYFQSYGQNI